MAVWNSIGRHGTFTPTTIVWRCFVDALPFKVLQGWFFPRLKENKKCLFWHRHRDWRTSLKRIIIACSNLLTYYAYLLHQKIDVTIMRRFSIQQLKFHVTKFQIKDINRYRRFLNCMPIVYFTTIKTDTDMSSVLRRWPLD